MDGVQKLLRDWWLRLRFGQATPPSASGITVIPMRLNLIRNSPGLHILT
jgi:hypothetical protein